MARCVPFGLILLIALGFPAQGESIKKQAREDAIQKQTNSPGHPIEPKVQKLYSTRFEFEFEQGNGICRDIERIMSTLDVLEDEWHVFGSSTKWGEEQGHQFSCQNRFQLKITPMDSNRIRLLITASQQVTEFLKDGTSQSWNLILEDRKTAKLGEKIKLDFGDDNVIPTKCTLESLIEEKGQDKK